jgi:hypothetical protein
MPTDNHFSIVHALAVKPAVEECGMDCNLITSFENDGQKTRKIIQEIFGADFIIIDLSDEKIEFLYEMGLAHGLLQKVVVITHKPENLLFGGKEFEPIDYDPKFDVPTMNALKEQIISRIQNFMDYERRSNPVAFTLPPRSLPVPGEKFHALQEEFESNQRRFAEQAKRVAELEEVEIERDESQRENSKLVKEAGDLRTKLEKSNLKIQDLEEKCRRFEEERAAWKKKEVEYHELQGVYNFVRNIFSPLLGQRLEHVKLEELESLVGEKMRGNQMKIQPDRRGRPKATFEPIENPWKGGEQ